MKTFKIILAVFFAVVIFGNISMFLKGELTSSWNLFAFMLYVIIEVLLLVSITKKKSEPTN